MSEENIPVFDQNDIQQNKAIAVLSCFPILFWLPFVACKDSQYAKFFANQGLLLLIFEVALSVVMSILAIIPIIGLIFSLLCSLLSIALFVFMILEMVAAGQGQAKEMPIIGGIKIFK